MGGGSYSCDSRSIRAKSSGYYTKTSEQIFTSRGIPAEMDPNGIKIRESKDSAEHPESAAIIIALDGTGSMGHVPLELVKDGLPNIMKKIIDNGIKDPQVLFMVIGDHVCDDAPLQVGQFESSDELLDKWLTTCWLEGGGGGNEGESYGLAWYFAGKHTDIDCFNKRNKKGILFTIGDEQYLDTYPGESLKQIMGGGQHDNINTAQDLLRSACEKYEVYHIHTRDTYHGKNKQVTDMWYQLLGDNFITAQGHQMIPDIIAEKVLSHFNSNITDNYTNTNTITADNTDEDKEEINIL